MANILPPEAQKNVWSMYRARFVLAASIVSLSLSALAALALVPSYLALQLAAPPVVDSVTAGGQNVPDNIAALARTQALVTAIDPILSSTSSPSSVILAALDARPAGVRVTHIIYTADPLLITFTGSASRGALSAYRDSLSADPRFTNISVPVDSLIGTNSDFTMSLAAHL